jgi:hypothetical protein
MKTIILSAVVAVIASVVTTMVLSGDNPSEVVQTNNMASPEIDLAQLVEQLDVNKLSISMEPEAAAWIRLGGGASSEQKILANAENSACFLTHVEFRGIQSEADHNSCSITLDDFTGFWQVNATTGEGTQSELFCNARCVVWE